MSNDARGPSLFAIRRVNPIAGVLQVARTPAARAYSGDGRGWQIQVLSERPDHTWRSDKESANIRQFFTFGLWDRERGLHKVLANPLMDLATMRRDADAMIGLLEESTPRLPFPLIDDVECWACDRHGSPFALVATTEDATIIGDLVVPAWRATPADASPFVSSTLQQRGHTSDSTPDTRDHASLLETQIRQRVHHQTWFRRTGDGAGVPLGHCAETLAGSVFPSLGLARDWPDQIGNELVYDYLEWQAPLLLQWQTLSDHDRSWLERAATRRAAALVDAYPLLPRIIDRAGIDAARVEATLRSANP